jgi:hypothetical protein
MCVEVLICNKKSMCNFVGIYVCLDLLTHNIYIYIYIERERERERDVCENIKREEMKLYLKRDVHMCRYACKERNVSISIYVCTFIMSFTIKGVFMYMCVIRMCVC